MSLPFDVCPESSFSIYEVDSYVSLLKMVPSLAQTLQIFYVKSRAYHWEFETFCTISEIQNFIMWKSVDFSYLTSHK